MAVLREQSCSQQTVEPSEEEAVPTWLRTLEPQCLGFPLLPQLSAAAELFAAYSIVESPVCALPRSWLFPFLSAPVCDDRSVSLPHASSLPPIDSAAAYCLPWSVFPDAVAFRC